jgi:hypothetical protein
MVPLSFVCLLGTIGFMFVPDDLRRVIGAATLGFGIAIIILFFIRVKFQIDNARPELYLKPHISGSRFYGCSKLRKRYLPSDRFDVRGNVDHVFTFDTPSHDDSVSGQDSGADSGYFAAPLPRYS